MISFDIDISKEKSMVCILKPYGELIAEPYEIKHTESDLKLLVETILKFKEETRVVMEATGAYHFPVLSYLKEHNIMAELKLIQSAYL